MLYNLAILLPATICLVWAIVLISVKKEESWQRVWTFTVVSAFFSFFCEAGFMTRTPDYKALPIIDILTSLFTTSLPPLTFLYILFLRNNKFRTKYLLAFILPVSLCSIITTNYVSMGMDKAIQYVAMNMDGSRFIHNSPEKIFRLQHLFGVHLFYSLLIVEVVVLDAYTVTALYRNKFNLKRFFKLFKGEEVMVEDLILVQLQALYCVFLIRILCIAFNARLSPLANVVISLIEAIMVYQICHSAMFTRRVTITMKELRNPYMTGEDILRSQESDNESKTVANTSVNLGLSQEIPISNYDKYLNEFERIVVVERRFLDPALTIDSLAEEMHTNHTYLSRLVNRRFKMSFREFVNSKRIAHAKQLMRENPSVVMELIAKSSGFQSTTQFNRKFKEMEGVSPRVWQITSNISSVSKGVNNEAT